MAPTVKDILRQTGFSDDDIERLDAKVLSGFETVLTEADNARTAAAAAAAESREIERRYRHMYETEIVPALNSWGSEKATLEATVDFYKKQNEGARTAGFIPKDAPNAEPARGADGRYIAGANTVPGSPAMTDAMKNEFLQGISEAQWASDTYKDLYETNAMPEGYDFYETLAEGTRNRMNFRQYFTQKYKLDDKRKERAERQAKAHDDAIRKEERAKIEKEFAERGGSNPGLKPAAASHYASVRKAVQSGTVKDPVKMSAEERRRQTRDMISADVAENRSQGNA